jgi:hypothetical protein
VASTARDGQKHHLQASDIASGEWLFSAEGRALDYGPDGQWLAVLAADEKTVLLLDARTHETAVRFSGHENVVFGAEDEFIPPAGEKMHRRRSLSTAGIRCFHSRSGIP